MTRNFGPECGHDLVKGGHEEVTYCSPSTSSGKQKETTPPVNRNSAVRGALQRSKIDYYLLALQPLPNGNSSAIFHNNVNRISKLLKSFKTTMHTFDGKSEKFELFEDLFQTSLKVHNQMTKENRINYFQSLVTGDALQTFENILMAQPKKIWEKFWQFFERSTYNTKEHKFQQISSTQRIKN